MRCLFFDIESSTGYFGDICEFGYVITNEKLDVISKENILINPNGRFCKRIMNEIVSYEKSEYKSKPDFTCYYEKIKEIVSSSDVVLGYSMTNDAIHLNAECKNYAKKCIDFNFYDVQRIVFEYDNSLIEIGLERALLKLNIKREGKPHNAMDDSYNTMLVLKSILDNLDFSLEELLKMVSHIEDKNINGIIESVEINHKNKKERIIERINKGKSIENDKMLSKIFNKYIKDVRMKKNSKSCLNGKKICVSKKFENGDFKDMMNLITLLARRGARYTIKESEADWYVKHQEDSNDSPRYNNVKHIINDGRKIKIIEFNELLKLLGVTLEDLLSTDLSILDYVVGGNSYERNRRYGYKLKKLRSANQSVYLKDFFKEEMSCYS